MLRKSLPHLRSQMIIYAVGMVSMQGIILSLVYCQRINLWQCLFLDATKTRYWDCCSNAIAHRTLRSNLTVK